MLIINYRDEAGYVSVRSDADEIGFLDGEVYFDDGAEDYRIPMSSLVSIVNVKDESSHRV